MYVTAREMQAGDTLRLAIAVTQSGAPLNLTGATLYMTAKTSITDADAAAIFKLTSPASGITITDAVNGLAEAVVVPSETAVYAGTTTTQLYYDIKVKTAAGDVTTVELGTLTISYAVTRETT